MKNWNIKNWNFAFIDRALVRQAPDRIPLSYPRCLDNDFFEAYITVEGLDWKLLSRTKEEHGYSGFLWVGDEPGINATVLFSTLQEYDFTVESSHYYKCYEFKYFEPITFLFALYFKRHRIRIFKDRLLQGVFNRRTLVRSERIEILRYLVERTIENPNYTTSTTTLGVQLNSTRWFSHPERTEHQNHYRLLLNSLVETGELRHDNHQYSVTGRALATLSEYEQEQQRHQDNYNAAKITHRLTLVLIVIGLAGIAARLFMWWSDKQ